MSRHHSAFWSACCLAPLATLLASTAWGQTPLTKGAAAKGSNAAKPGAGGKSPTAEPLKAPLVPAVISELRAYGPAGDDDSFVEISNTTSESLDVGGWSLQYQNPQKQLVVAPIRAGTVIPAQGHLLLVGKRYSLKSYAIGDITLSETIASGVRLCDPQSTIVDAVGPQAVGLSASSPLPPRVGTPDRAATPDRAVTTARVVVPEVFGEGRGLALVAFESPTLHAGSKAQFSCVRRHLIGQNVLQDTNDNAADFFVVSVNGTLDETTVRLGAPGPQNLSDTRLDYPLRPVSQGKGIVAPKAPSGLTQTQTSQTAGVVVHASATLSGKLPRLRSNAANGANGQYGTLTLRYRLVNETVQTIKRFSLSVTGITAGEGPKGTADLRLLTPPGAKRLAVRGKEAVSRPSTTGATLTSSTSQATPILYGILDEPPAQTDGGGLNSSMTFEMPQGLTPGKAVELRFLLGVQERGRYLVTVDGVGLTATFSGDTENGDGVWQATTRSTAGTSPSRLAMNPGRSGPNRGVNGGNGSGNAQNGQGNVPLPANADPIMVASIIVMGNTEDDTEPPVTKSPLNLSASVADAASNIIALRFTGPLDPASARTLGNYTVSNADGKVIIEQASYSEGDQSVTIRLAEGSLQRGDMVTIVWKHLRDTQGREINGQVGPIRVP